MNSLAKGMSGEIMLPTPYAAMKVVQETSKKIALVPDGFMIVRASTKFVKLDPKFQVVDDEGNPVKPDGVFFVSTETLDPYHLLIDYR